jgi:hypothetical protein
MYGMNNIKFVIFFDYNHNYLVANFGDFMIEHSSEPYPTRRFF